MITTQTNKQTNKQTSKEKQTTETDSAITCIFIVLIQGNEKSLIQSKADKSYLKSI